MSLIFHVNGEKNNCYPGKVYLNNSEIKTGYIGKIFLNSKTISIYRNRDGDGNSLVESIQADSIRNVDLYNENAPEKIHSFEFLNIQTYRKNYRYWLCKIAEGPFVRTFIAAESYEINSTGKLNLLSKSVYIGGSSASTYSNSMPPVRVPPSFPVYMIKRSDEVAGVISLRHGVKFEDSGFRSGFSRYLADDTKLCELIRKNKLGFDDIEMITKLYNPERGDEPLIYNDVELVEKTYQLITDYFNRELAFKFEWDIPFDNGQHGIQARIGINSTFSKFFAYGFELGYGSAQFVDESLLPLYKKKSHLITDMHIKRSHGFMFSTFSGIQLPLDLKSYYLIPGLSLSLGGLISENNNTYLTFHYAPALTLDLGLKQKYGDVIFLGMGWRRYTPIVNEEQREDQTYNGFSFYNNYSSLFFRTGYKF